MTDVHRMYPRDTSQRTYLRNEIVRSFETLRIYCEHLDDVRSSALRELQSNIDTLLEADADDERFLSLDFEQREDIEDLFGKFQWSSALIVSCAQFEVLIGGICRSAHHPTDLSLSDVQGQGIRRAKLFLEKVCHVDLSPARQDWQAIKMLADLRNHVVHGDEFFDPKKNNNLVRVANGLPGIGHAEMPEMQEISASRKIRIRPSRETLTFCIDVFQRFLLFVLDESGVTV